MADETTTKDAPETAQAPQDEATTPEPQASAQGTAEADEGTKAPQAQGEAPDEAAASGAEDSAEEADEGAAGIQNAGTQNAGTQDEAAPAAQDEAAQDEAAPADTEATDTEATDTEATDTEAAAEQEEAEGAEEPAAEPKRERESTIEELLKAGVHFGHLTSRWHPRMDEFIFMERNNIHIIDLMQSQVLLDEAADAARRFAKRGKEILFVGTKKQAQEIVRRHAEESEQPFMVERWLGGTMTNFQTIQRSIHRMEDIERMEKDGTLDKLKKKERLVRLREHDKLENVLGGIRDLARLPGAIYVVDIRRENIAVNEANKLGIPVIAMVDTNCDPEQVDHAVPANDDALSSIELVTSVIARAIQEGQAARERERQAKKQEANA